MRRRLPAYIVDAIEFASRVVRRHAVVFVVSDFLDTGWERALSLCARRHDVVGVEIGGSLKNVMALAVGVATGLGLGYNPRAALMSRGLFGPLRSCHPPITVPAWRVMASGRDAGANGV